MALSTEAEGKPAIVIVQGAFLTSAHYAKLANGLVDQGHRVSQPTLPTCVDAKGTDKDVDLLDDALAVRSELIRLVEYEHRQVVLVMHSYGGLVGSEAVAIELTAGYRRKHSMKGGVIHLYLFSAGIVDVGQSFSSAFGEVPNVIRMGGVYSRADARDVFFDDFSEADAEHYAALLVPQSSAALETVLTRAAYQFVASTYLICEKDKAAPAAAQRMFGEKAGSRLETCPAGHFPNITWTEGLVNSISSAAQRAAGEFR